ncbi:MAG: DUF1109 family protein [Proteobacteria bacterium]|nr:DUF1109 family protein [Pseudomonadota bacterium]
MRTMLWLVIALLYVVVVLLIMSPRADLAEKLVDSRYQIEQLAALATAVAAAISAFTSIVPGRSRAYSLIPLLPLIVWLGSLSQGCLQDWLRIEADGFDLRPDWVCFPSIALVGAVPASAMVIMLRRGAPLSPHATAALGALAAAALGNFGLRFFHPQDASLMVLVWQFGSVALMSATAGWFGRRVIDWRFMTART